MKLQTLTSVAVAAVSYLTTIKPLVDENCVPCHHSTFDLSVFPFQGSSWPTQEETVQNMIDRMRRADWKRMPPQRVREQPLPDETLLFHGHFSRGRAVSSVYEERRWHPWFAGTRDDCLARLAHPSRP